MVLSTINPNQQKENNHVCKAHIKLDALHVVVKPYTLFPDYAIHPNDIEGKSKYNIRLLKEQNLKKLQNEIESGCVKQATRHWLSSPTLEAHEKTHPVKQAAVFSQVNPAATQMIAELVADGITEIDDVK